MPSNGGGAFEGPDDVKALWDELSAKTGEGIEIALLYAAEATVWS